MSGDGWKYMTGQSKFCASCGKKIVLKDRIWFDSKNKLSYHMGCYPIMNLTP